MSHRAITRRQHYIDSRLRYRQDYPSGPDLVRGLREECGETVSKWTLERDMDEMRDRGAPIEYDRRKHGYHYSDLSTTILGGRWREGVGRGNRTNRSTGGNNKQKCGGRPKPRLMFDDSFQRKMIA